MPNVRRFCHYVRHPNINSVFTGIFCAFYTIIRSARSPCLCLNPTASCLQTEYFYSEIKLLSASSRQALAKHRRASKKRLLILCANLPIMHVINEHGRFLNGCGFFIYTGNCVPCTPNGISKPACSSTAGIMSTLPKRASVCKVDS